MLTRHEIISKFLSAMAEQGMECREDIIDDGHFHAFSTNGDKGGKRSGRYFLRMDGVPAGFYGCWRRNEWHTWSAKQESQMSPKERQAFKQAIAQARAKHETERQEKHRDARAEARNIWNMAVPASDQHPYLKAKGLPHGNLKSYDDKLVIPLVDAQGTIHSLQYIGANGFKQFLEGGAVGGHYHVIGNPQPRGTIYIAEGVATAITVHMATKQGVIVAFNSGNLTPVAQAIRQKYLDAGIVVCGDDDQFNETNAGRKHANEAARAVNGKVSFPQFGDLSTKPTDWDDLRMREGLEAVTQQLAGNASEPEIEPEPFNGFFTMDEMRVTEWLNSPPKPRQWIIEDMMPTGKTGLLVGFGGTGKGFALLQLCISVAGGYPLFGRYPIDQTGAVVAFFAEDDTDILHERFANAVDIICDLPEINSHEFRASLEERLFIRSMAGRDVAITRPSPEGPVRTENFNKLMATVKQIHDPRLIILDNSRRFMGGDENTSEQGVAFIQAVEHLSQETGAFVLVVQHMNKNAMRKGGDAMDQSAARGSSALTDAVRWQMNMATMDKDTARKYGIRDEKERKMHVQIGLAKQNYGVPFGDAWLKRGKGGYLHHIELNRKEKAEDGRILQDVIKVLKECADKNEQYSKRKFCVEFCGKDKLGCGRDKLHQIIDRAIERELIYEGEPKGDLRGIPTVLYAK